VGAIAEGLILTPSAILAAQSEMQYALAVTVFLIRQEMLQDDEHLVSACSSLRVFRLGW
jgi:hypothetical protein